MHDDSIGADSVILGENAEIAYTYLHIYTYFIFHFFEIKSMKLYWIKITDEFDSNVE